MPYPPRTTARLLASERAKPVRGAKIGRAHILTPLSPLPLPAALPIGEGRLHAVGPRIEKDAVPAADNGAVVGEREGEACAPGQDRKSTHLNSTLPSSPPRRSSDRRGPSARCGPTD